MPKKASPSSQKQKAVCVVFSWMRAWNIDARLPGPGEGDLVVAGKRVVLSEGREAGEHDLALAPSAILGSDLKQTIAELHRLTTFLERGTPAGFREAPSGRASSADYLAVSMRLTPFTRAPNIPTGDIVRWVPTLKREADRAARRCAGILANVSLDKHDLFNIGLVYLTNFLARHAPLGDEKKMGQQLTMSLMQQYGRWADVTIRHMRSVAPVTAGLPVDFLMGSPCPNSRMEDARGTDQEASYTFDPTTPDEPVDEEPDFASPEDEERYWKRKAMKDGRYQAKRRRNAAAALEMALAEMPHDRMLHVLGEVRDSEFQHPDAREEAARRLEAHQAACPRCQPTSIAPSADTRTSAPVEAA